MNNCFLLTIQRIQMKSLLSIFAFLTISASIMAQTPGIINYQAALKDANGNPIANESATVNVAISVGGEVYQESVTGMTDEFGIINIQFGGSELKALSWETGNASISVSISSSQGTVSMGSMPLAAVPYALYAENSGNSIPGPAPQHE
jgi:hypothetical protein